MISMIWAMDRNWLIGKDDKLPWHIPEDLKHFRKTTFGKPVIMGLRTFYSLGKALPGRRNIVLNFDQIDIPGCEIATSIEQAIEKVKDEDEAFVIGGGSVYKQFLPYAEQLYITFIDNEFEGNIYFPKFNISEWKLASERKELVDGPTPFYIHFRKYRRA